MRYITFPFISMVLLFSLACTPSRKSATGFRLPDGDVEQGKATFIALKCNECHQVVGVDIPASKLPVPITLGGLVAYPKTDGRLVSMIIDPSTRMGPSYRKDVIQVETLSHMATYSSAMTVRQLVDIVAFLQSHYEVQPMPVPQY